MSNAAEPFHDYSIILEKTCSVSFCLNSVVIRSLNIFCCVCTLVKLSLKYSVHFVFVVCQVKRFGNAGEHICCLCKYQKEYLPERYVFGDTWQTLYCYSIFCICSQMSRLIWNSSDISWRVYITFHENLYFMCLSCYNNWTLLCVELWFSIKPSLRLNESLSALLQTQNYHFNSRGCIYSVHHARKHFFFWFSFFPLVDYTSLWHRNKSVI